MKVWQTIIIGSKWTLSLNQHVRLSDLFPRAFRGWRSWSGVGGGAVRLPFVPRASESPRQHHRARLLASQHQRVHGGLQHCRRGSSLGVCLFLPVVSHVESVLVLNLCHLSWSSFFVLSVSYVCVRVPSVFTYLSPLAPSLHLLCLSAHTGLTRGQWFCHWVDEAPRQPSDPPLCIYWHLLE